MTAHRQSPAPALALAGVLAAALTLGVATTARAQAGGAATMSAAGSSDTALRAERQRLASRLAVLHADIARLKAGGRTVAGDFVLRDRLAEAETIAKRLSAIDARLGPGAAAPSAPAATPAPWSAAPSPGDGPPILEAKADLLADEARGLVRRAEALERSVASRRERGELERRARRLERDPFAGVEGSKRRALSTTGSTDTSDPGAGKSAPPTGRGTAGGDSAGGGPPASKLHSRDVLGGTGPATATQGPGAAAGETSVESLEQAARDLRLRAAELERQAASLRARARQ